MAMENSDAAGVRRLNEEIDLLERATSGITLVVCEKCGPDGKVGPVEPANHRIPCGVCGGSKLTTNLDYDA